MVELPMFWLEACVAVVVVGVYLCAKPEHALFLYGLALGFPDLAFPVGTAVNIRVDDLLILLFLIRFIIWTPASSVTGQRKIFRYQMFLFAFCIFSAVVQFARGVPLAPYETAKMVGCAAIVWVLPRILQSEQRLRALIVGLTCGGIALAIQIAFRMASSSASAQANFQEYKNAATFATWNPNTLGQAAMLTAFAAGLGAILYSKSGVGKIIWPALACGFALIPAAMFVRGTALSIAAGFLLFFCLTRRWKWVMAFMVLCLFAVAILRATEPDLFADATRVNISTGDGLSHRFERWETALSVIRQDPLFGQGFGQEWVHLSSIGSEGRAHNAYLTVWLELGIGGLALVLAVIYQIVNIGYSLYTQPRFQMHGALLLSLIFAMCLDSFGLPTLYWEKLPTIAISIGVALAGICEREFAQAVPNQARALILRSLPQHS
jgi:O-antigen ligase